MSESESEQREVNRFFSSFSEETENLNQSTYGEPYRFPSNRHSEFVSTGSTSANFFTHFNSIAMWAFELFRQCCVSSQPLSSQRAGEMSMEYSRPVLQEKKEITQRFNFDVNNDIFSSRSLPKSPLSAIFSKRSEIIESSNRTPKSPPTERELDEKMIQWSIVLPDDLKDEETQRIETLSKDEACYVALQWCSFIEECMRMSVSMLQKLSTPPKSKIKQNILDLLDTDKNFSTLRLLHHEEGRIIQDVLGGAASRFASVTSRCNIYCILTGYETLAFYTRLRGELLELVCFCPATKNNYQLSGFYGFDSFPNLFAFVERIYAKDTSKNGCSAIVLESRFSSASLSETKSETIVSKHNGGLSDVASGAENIRNSVEENGDHEIPLMFSMDDSSGIQINTLQS